MIMGRDSQRPVSGKALLLSALLAGLCAVLASYSGGAWAQAAAVEAPGDTPGAVVPTLGERPAPGTVLPALPSGAPQPSADPRDFNGVWYREPPLEFLIPTDMLGYPLPFTAAGRKVAERRMNALKNGTPFINASVRCFPPGQPWLMELSPFRIFQSKDFLDVQFQEYHGFFEILMDPAKALPSAYMGSSVGHWDGDTLVVVTRGFKDGLWLSARGRPATKDATLTQRIRKVKAGRWYLEVVFTLEDPAYYTHPWSWVRDYSWRPDMALFTEYNCELQTGAKNGIDGSLVPEPQD